MQILSKILIKIMLVGPSPVKFLRIINPKHYIINDNFGNERWIGCVAGMLRSYDKLTEDMIDQLLSFYPLAVSLISNVSFRFVSSYLIDFMKKYALRSAVAAIMGRNMSHNIGSHVLNYLSNPEELDNLWII